jgi:hypothetical protein
VPNQIAAVDPYRSCEAAPTWALPQVAYSSASITPGGLRRMYGAPIDGHSAASVPPSGGPTVPTSWPPPMPWMDAPLVPGGVRSIMLWAVPAQTTAWESPRA